MKRILIVDDEANIGASLRLILEGEGHAVTVCRTAREFRNERANPAADVYLLDVRLPDGNGIDLVRFLRQSDNDAPIIMISGHGTIADAVEATRAGAFDFLEKPLSREKVLLAVKNAIAQANLRRENARFRETAGGSGEGHMIGSSPAFLHAIEQATRVAQSDARVLLQGESGTGKELLAALIHRSSPFADGPFIKVNCAAIPAELIESELFGHEKGAFTGATATRRGKFELADNGTLFLDEVGDLLEPSQAKLLRVLQEGEFQRVGGDRTIGVQVRVLSATNRNLSELVGNNRFREDLFYRLNVVPILVPPLRERREDIVPLVDHFLREFSIRNNFKPRTMDPETINALQAYAWPGNIRELKNTVERMAILAHEDRIGIQSLPVEIRTRSVSDGQSSLQQTRESAERERILRALDQVGWNISAAARLLNVERTSLHKRIRALGLKGQ